jgi:hypothetical protein
MLAITSGFQKSMCMKSFSNLFYTLTFVNKPIYMYWLSDKSRYQLLWSASTSLPKVLRVMCTNGYNCGFFCFIISVEAWDLSSSKYVLGLQHRYYHLLHSGFCHQDNTHCCGVPVIHSLTYFVYCVQMTSFVIFSLG